MKKMIGAAAAVLIAVAGGGYWYVHWYTKTPTYTIDEIRAAAVEHDPEAFERRVNLDRVVSSGTDDVMGFMMGDAGDAIMGTPFARDIVCAVKPAVVSGLKDTILMMVKTGTFDGTDRAQSHAQGQKDASANTIIEKSGARSIDFSGIDYVKENDDGDKANVGIRIDEPDLGNYVLDIAMERQSDRTWQVVAVTNLREYLDALSAAKKTALNDYLRSTKPIIDQYNDELKAMRAAAKLASPELVAKIIENREKLAVALSGVAVPDAAQDVATKRQEYIACVVEYLKGVKESLSGNDNITIMRAAREANRQAERLGAELEMVESSANGSMSVVK